MRAEEFTLVWACVASDESSYALGPTIFPPDLVMQAKEQRTKDLGTEIITGAFKVGERGMPSLGQSDASTSG